MSKGTAEGLSQFLAMETWLPQGEQAAYLRSLTHLGESLSLESGVCLFSQGQIDQAFYVVVEGRLHVHMLSEDGQESILNIMGPGSVIGEAAAVLQRPRCASARTMEPSRLLRFDIRRMPAMVASDPTFAMAMLYLLSIKQRQAIERLRQTVFDPPEQRIVQFLEQFRVTHQHPESPGRAVAVDLTHEQIGHLTDLSRVTVTRVLNRFRRDGVIAFSGRRVLLLKSLVQPSH
ncbi:Crp/Fnr family transcriptional regulator [Cupriavidus basilensis]|uniref:Crp/Fnr family transcriptional regulator n=1 Tax=Cupriavidus basilensis TaxID=68895 RepID=UPI000751392A|nr:Crp/Fnr family transcriptional regulator [Cupriavidus basilensis]